jgi:tripartite-type tricarboxylate transporter receptor subunit TctC
MKIVLTTIAQLAACALALLPASAPAQDYPSRAIRFVVPFTAGSATDALARILGQKLNAAFGWTIVVENIAGASGQTAASNVARAAPAFNYPQFHMSPEVGLFRRNLNRWNRL